MGVESHETTFWLGLSILTMTLQQILQQKTDLNKLLKVNSFRKFVIERLFHLEYCVCVCSLLCTLHVSYCKQLQVCCTCQSALPYVSRLLLVLQLEADTVQWYTTVGSCRLVHCNTRVFNFFSLHSVSWYSFLVDTNQFARFSNLIRVTEDLNKYL